MEFALTGASRKIAFVASMGALGNVLALLSVFIPLVPPQITPDLSHVGTLIVALYSGPVLGGIAGALVAIVPFYRYGVMGWLGPLVGFMIVPVKALTGITAGILGKKFRPLLATLLGYVPEFVCTYLYFTWLVPFFIPGVSSFITQGFLLALFTKAWLELAGIALLMESIKRRRLLNHVMAGMS
jgi:riboflavin transporter FmnP